MGSIGSIIMLVVMLYILVEWVLPLGKKLINSFRARQSYVGTTVSYM